MAKIIPPTLPDNAPLVTVVTATYNLIQNNRVEYFHECIKSVYAQTYKNIEHLIIDGGSTDGTLDIFRGYQQSGMIRVISEPDKGIYDAFNKGIQHAKGKYIAFLNSDDFWHDSRGVEYSVHALEVADADFSYADHLIINDSNNASEEFHASISRFFSWFSFCHQTMFSRTQCLRDIGGFNLNYKIVADYDATLRLLLRGARCVHVPLNFTSFRTVGLSSENTMLEQLRRELDEVRKQLFFPHLTDSDLNLLKKGYLNSNILFAFSQMLHPSVHSALRSRCSWDWIQKAWLYSDKPHSKGMLAQALSPLHRRMRNYIRALCSRITKVICTRKC